MDLVTRQREERKQRILEVARQLIAEHGYDGVTMRDLAEKSLVSVPTLYNLFGGKNDLLFAAVESYFVDLMGNAQLVEAEEGLAKIISLAETRGDCTSSWRASSPTSSSGRSSRCSASASSRRGRIRALWAHGSPASSASRPSIGPETS
jgi:AcrR family transcriptional regulator